MKNPALVTVLAATAVLSACATSQLSPTVTAPENLKVPADQVFALEMPATGVQIYECKAKKDEANKFEWVFRAPEAELNNQAGAKTGRHYAGPTWEANDGSKVVGEVVAKNDGPDANAIPWLLLKAKSNAGSGVFSKVTSIQRVLTLGGKAPLTGCSQYQVGAEQRVPYKAVYNFYKARS
ncbi:DUF3455 domain-containing protein [Undibacterium sp. TJN19]|uniref:DUF3455 domain-containing protein n=1 Tax=Undibacterium sp. TJN19 TaxID=3413055 RepID=UPI003BF3A3CD